MRVLVIGSGGQSKMVRDIITQARVEVIDFIKELNEFEKKSREDADKFNISLIAGPKEPAHFEDNRTKTPHHIKKTKRYF